MGDKEITKALATILLGWTFEDAEKRFHKKKLIKTDTFSVEDWLELIYDQLKPLENWNHTMMIVREMEKKHWALSMSYDFNAWDVSFWNIDTKEKVTANWRNEVKKQICLAALEAAGVALPEK